MTGYATDVSRVERFEFGSNLARFLKVLNDERIALMKKSLWTLVADQTYSAGRHGGWVCLSMLPEEIFDFYRNQGFTLVQMKTCAGGLGCNEFVFFNETISK